jgi:hypothetical protein
MVAKPSVCIFCQGTPLNSEHAWGKWLRPFFPASAPNYRKLSVIEHRDRSDFEIRTRAGDPKSLKVRCVCCDCNSGWMSELQSAAKPIGIPLALGKPGLLDAGKLLTLATWITMLTITSEYSNPRMVAIPQTDYDHVYKKKYAPQHFRIWIGHLAPNQWPSIYIHHPLAIVEPETEEERNSLDAVLSKLNTQSSTFAFGQLFVHVISISAPNVDLLQRWQMPPPCAAALREIWPLPGHNIIWPPPIGLTTATAQQCADAFFNFCKRSEARRQARLDDV